MGEKLRGARPTPRHKLAGVAPHRIVGASPPQVIVVPPFLEMWLNDQYGSCVSTQEAFSKAAYSVQKGLPETKITDATLMAFCTKYDLLNGADLPQVMDLMIKDGFHQDGVTYTDGPYQGIDYANEAILQNAISIGPVNIGIDANALPSEAGNANGWYASGGSPGQFNNEDHCVALCGYGPSAALFQALGVPMPSGFPANGYLLFTWSTIGVVDHAWLMSTCGEAWLRNPTTPGLVPPIPPDPHVCPVGQHWDAIVNACVPDVPGPIPGPIVSTGNLTIPPLSVKLFGWLQIATTEPITLPISVTSGVAASGQTIALVLPPWLLAALRVLCVGAPMLPPPFNMIAGFLCTLLPPGHEAMIAAGKNHTATITPLELFILNLVCNLAKMIPNIPPQLLQIINDICSLVPPQARGAAYPGKCGCN
jgi:hypothetical protein